MRKNKLQNSCVPEGLSATETPPMRSSSAVTPLWKPFFGLHKARTLGLVEKGAAARGGQRERFFFFFGSISIYSVDDQTIKEPRQQSGVWKGV